MATINMSTSVSSGTVRRTVADPAASTRTPFLQTWAGRLVPPLLVLVVVLAVWTIVSTVVLAPSKRFLLPSPLSVAQALVDPKVMSTIGGGLVQTVVMSLTGVAIAIVLGVAWGIAMSQARWIERSLFPYAVILQSIPILALVPLVGFWFGYEFTARVIICVLIALFPMVSNTLFGLQAVPKGQRELFQLQKASRLTTLLHLELPTAMPAIFAGMRISAGLSVVGAIVGDFYFRRGTPGLGSAIAVYQSRLQSAELFAAITVASLVGVVIFEAFGLLGRLAVGRWYESTGR